MSRVTAADSTPEPTDRTAMMKLRIAVVAAGLLVVLLPLNGLGQDGNAASPPGSTATETPEMPSVWDLAVQGGVFMIPIALMSIVAIGFSFERLIGLQGKRILPIELILALKELRSETGIDPRRAWKVCQEHPSPLASVVRAAILKTGRPHAEVEKAVEDAAIREIAEMSRNLRPVNVVATIAPLLGLIGTVQGMIMAFMVTSTTDSTGTAKSQELATGIYTALVTTFAGLCVAVIAVLLANYLEGRIERLLRQLEDVFLELLPDFERFEGKLRVSRTAEDADGSGVLLKSPRRPVPGNAPQRPASAASGKSAGNPSAVVAAFKQEPLAESASSSSDSLIFDEGDDASDEAEYEVSQPRQVRGLWDVMSEDRHGHADEEVQEEN